MKWRFDFKAMREELRKLGLALMVAGVVGGLIEDVPLSSVIYAALAGAALVLGSLFSTGGET